MVVALSLAPSGCGETFDDASSATGKSIGAGGGFVTSTDGVLTLIVPAGALDDTHLVTIESTTDTPASIGLAYRVSPNLQTAEPIVVAYRYQLPVIMERDPEELTIGRDAGDTWEKLTRISLDPFSQQVAVEDDRLSFAYGLVEDISQSGDEGSGTGSDDGTATEGGDTEPVPTGTGDTGDTTHGETGDTGRPTGCGDGDAAPGELCLAPADALGHEPTRRRPRRPRALHRRPHL